MNDYKVLAKLTNKEIKQIQKIENEIAAIKELQNNLVDRLTEAKIKRNELLREIVEKYKLQDVEKYHLNVKTKEICEGWL
ncbi:MAG: hypothetical protein H0Z24_06670 [Thermosipho sp. (in: Bacteria)]|nr:hypothetical protein [Thermosipho sp. (in: thermotogales)]